MNSQLSCLEPETDKNNGEEMKMTRNLQTFEQQEI